MESTLYERGMIEFTHEEGLVDLFKEPVKRILYRVYSNGYRWVTFVATNRYDKIYEYHVHLFMKEDGIWRGLYWHTGINGGPENLSNIQFRGSSDSLSITADWYEDDGSGNRVLWKMSLTNAVRTLICCYPDEDLLFEGEEKIKESMINLGNKETIAKRS